jgi:hypothetical protein
MVCSVLAERTSTRRRLDGGTHWPPMNNDGWSIVITFASCKGCTYGYVLTIAPGPQHHSHSMEIVLCVRWAICGEPGPSGSRRTLDDAHQHLAQSVLFIRFEHR